MHTRTQIISFYAKFNEIYQQKNYWMFLMRPLREHQNTNKTYIQQLHFIYVST